MSYQWYYQQRTGWRAWRKFCAPFFLGWLICSPTDLIMWPDWRWLLGLLIGQFLLTLMITLLVCMLGAGPYIIEKEVQHEEPY